MPTAESYEPQSSRLSRLAKAQQAMIPGSLEGRFRQASPVPERTYTEAVDGLTLYIGDDDPGLGAGYDFWFDTDEPIP